MSRNRVRSNAFAMLACSALLFAAFGCSNPGSVTAPDSAPIVVDSPTFVNILPASKGEPSISAVQSVSAMISARQGGVVSNGRVTVEFPAGALRQDTEITIDLLDDGTLGAELSPHGIEFRRRVTMTMDLDGTDSEGMGETVQIYYYNANYDHYELMPKAPSSDNETSCYLRHFSKYKGGVGG